MSYEVLIEPPAEKDLDEAFAWAAKQAPGRAHDWHARLLEAIDRGRSEPLQESVATLLRELAQWHGSERPHDDISILAVEVSVASGIIKPAEKVG